jgi:hypothetical protein
MYSGGADDPMNWTVEEFLQQFNAALEFGQVWWHEVGRRMDEIADLGLTRDQVVNELRCLQAVHHHRGPEPDDNEPNLATVNKFRYPLPGGPDVYVKIALKRHPKRPNVLIAKIWSFKRWE